MVTPSLPIPGISKRFLPPFLLSRVAVSLLLLVSLSRTALASTAPASDTSSPLPFRLVQGFAIIVPVFIDGSGPYDLLLDTGSSATTIDLELAQTLQLKPRAHGTVTTLVRRSAVSLAFARTVRIGPIAESNVQLMVRDVSALRRLDPQLRGVLGQNVLQHADYLLDYKQRHIEFDPDGQLLASLSGTRTPVAKLLAADNPDYSILVVRTTIIDNGVQQRNFVVDSGSASLVLFTGRTPFDLPRLQSVIVDSEGEHITVGIRPVELRLGNQTRQVFAQIHVFPTHTSGYDSLLPTSLFQRLYISNSGSFVIFAPKPGRRTEPARRLQLTLDPQTHPSPPCATANLACSPALADKPALSVLEPVRSVNQPENPATQSAN